MSTQSPTAATPDKSPQPTDSTTTTASSPHSFSFSTDANDMTAASHASSSTTPSFSSSSAPRRDNITAPTTPIRSTGKVRAAMLSGRGLSPGTGLGAAPASIPADFDVDELPPHLRDHVQSASKVSTSYTTQMSEGETLPPLSNPLRPAIRAEVAEPVRRAPTKRVIVCGAGIIGLTTCYYLSQHGHEVLCVEKESSVGTQSSLCNSALLDPAVFSAWADGTLDKNVSASSASAGTRTGKSSIEASRIAASRRTTDDSWSPRMFARGAIAAAAGEESLEMDSPDMRSPVTMSATTPTRTKAPRTGGPGWNGAGKATRVEFSAVCDPKFWKWRLKHSRNSKKAKVAVHGRTIRELGFYSMCKLRELQDQYKKGEVDMDETAEGTIEVFRNDNEFDHMWASDRRKHLDELGMDLQPLDPDEAEQLEPTLRPEVFAPGAVLSAYGTSGDVHKMCQALYRLCVRKGVMFRFNTEVWDVLTDKSQKVIALQTRRGALIEGDEFVLALGNSTATVAGRAGLHLSTYPVRGYVVSVPVNKQFSAPIHNVYTGGMALIAPLGRWLRISGGGDFANPKKQHETQSRLDWLLGQAKSLFPEGYLNTEQVKTQVCYRPVTPDDVPLVGRTKVTNLCVNTGHGSKGWTLSFGAAAMLADEISGVRPKLDISKYDPHRFGMFG